MPAATAKPFRHTTRVYWEDTDAGGIVYYANYLKFFERARTEWLRSLGLEQQRLRERDGTMFIVSQTAIRERHGVIFAVREVQATYLAPARLEDQLVVTTRVDPPGGARLVMEQEVWRPPTCLFKCRVTLACLGSDGRPARLPAEVRAAFGVLPPLGDGP